MQKILLLIVGFFVFISLNAQLSHSSEDISAKHMARLLHRSPDQVVFKEYVITVQSALAGAYGYDITKAGKVIISQRRNPFTQSPIGLQRKEDVIKIARWQISQFNDRTQSAPLVNPPLPKNLSHQLKVQVR